jgi:hypothetical protein
MHVWLVEYLIKIIYIYITKFKRFSKIKFKYFFKIKETRIHTTIKKK